MQCWLPLPTTVLATAAFALGIALVKPCVVGTTARASKENVRSIGYSIYYTMVNIGGAATLAMMLPFIFKMSPAEAFAFLLGMQSVAALAEFVAEEGPRQDGSLVTVEALASGGDLSGFLARFLQGLRASPGL